MCHWPGQRFGNDFCKARRFVAAELEKQSHKAAALSWMCQASFLPATARSVNRPIALAEPTAPDPAAHRSPLPPRRDPPQLGAAFVVPGHSCLHVVYFTESHRGGRERLCM